MTTNSGSGGGPNARPWRAAWLVALAVAVASVGCTPPGDPGQAGPSIVATTTVLGDVAGRVGECGGLEVSTLIPVGADPHDYAPSSAEVRDVVRADLVIANGLGLEEGLASALESAREDGAVVLEVAPLLDPQPMASSGDSGAALDPHVWLDVARVATAAALIGAELAELTGDASFTACGDQVAAGLMVTDATVREILEAVPADSRILVTDHDAFGYFARAYGFEVGGVVIPGGSTLAETSSRGLAELAAAVRDRGIPAVFANTAHRTQLLEALSAEAGGVSVVELYVGSVGPEGSGAEDYPTMMVTNARRIAQALAPQTAP